AAQVNLLTKSGSNSLHGSAFEEHKNTIFNANDFFNGRTGVPTPQQVRNIFGGSLGGPIKKDKLFFFYSFEGDRWAKADPISRTVPLPSMGQGQLRYIDTTGAVQTLSTAQLNTIFDQVLINPAAVAVLADAAAKYPANDPSKGDQVNTSGFRFNSATPEF